MAGNDLYKPSIQEKIDNLIDRVPSVDARLFYIKGLSQVYYILCQQARQNDKTREMHRLFEDYVNVLYNQMPDTRNIDAVNELVNQYMLPVLTHLGRDHHYSIHNNLWFPIIVGLIMDVFLGISGYLSQVYYIPVSTITLVTMRSAYEHYKRSRNKLLYLK